ncbi:hypothetical protein NDU88_005399 [Pleurodeles waltl]|uniref:Uncharacterized protein n=1 Tax=Pleurodeles waltl TaxID=8319 RepID=A0AAV7NRE5_PLEWA|nr:hypothetical protein NDU88_005399 [Pleurodeles waltl]
MVARITMVRIEKQTDVWGGEGELEERREKKEDAGPGEKELTQCSGGGLRKQPDRKGSLPPTKGTAEPTQRGSRA